MSSSLVVIARGCGSAKRILVILSRDPDSTDPGTGAQLLAAEVGKMYRNLKRMRAAIRTTRNPAFVRSSTRDLMGLVEDCCGLLADIEVSLDGTGAAEAAPIPQSRPMYPHQLQGNLSAYNGLIELLADALVGHNTPGGEHPPSPPSTPPHGRSLPGFLANALLDAGSVRGLSDAGYNRVRHALSIAATKAWVLRGYRWKGPGMVDFRAETPADFMDKLSKNLVLFFQLDASGESLHSHLMCSNDTKELHAGQCKILHFCGPWTDGRFELEGNVVRDAPPLYLEGVETGWVDEEYTFMKREDAEEAHFCLTTIVKTVHLAWKARVAWALASNSLAPDVSTDFLAWKASQGVNQPERTPGEVQAICTGH
ncbi:hypothetical protein OQA88_4573 [Cercophora sp. LCS_1]